MRHALHVEDDREHRCGGRAELFVRRPGLQSRPDPGRRHDQHAGDAKGTGLTFNFSNTTTGTGIVLRAQVTNGTTTWCTNITTSPAVIPYSSFKIDCYDATPGAAYNKEPITQIQLNLAGGTAAGTINITLNSVTEN